MGIYKRKNRGEKKAQETQIKRRPEQEKKKTKKKKKSFTNSDAKLS